MKSQSPRTERQHHRSSELEGEVRLEAGWECKIKPPPIYHGGHGERRLNKTLILLCRKELPETVMDEEGKERGGRVE